MIKNEAKPLALGFIGGALQSAVGYAHYVSSAMDGRWRLQAGCFSRDQESNRVSAEAYGVAAPRTYNDWRTLLAAEKGRLDALVVLTPTPTHCEIVSACLRAGYPVICEKALGTSSAEIRQIVEARDSSHGFLAVTFNYSGYPMVRELRRLVESGRLGRLLHFQAEMPQEGFVRVDAHGNKPCPQSWRLHDGQVPTIYLDLAVHLHHLLHFLLGRSPQAVVADQSSFGWFPEIVDNVGALCRYEDGVQGQMWFSKAALGQRNGLRLRIYGSEASAEWYQANPEEILLAYADGRRETLDRAGSVEVAGLRRYNRFKAGHPAGFLEGFANLYGDIADCLCQFRESGHWHSDEVFGAELAQEGLDMLEAMVRSVRSGRWEKIGKVLDE